MTIHRRGTTTDAPLAVSPLYAHDIDADVVPRFQLCENMVSAPLATAIVRDELLLDGSARLNAATFCSTFLEPELAAVVVENLTKNITNHDEYPASVELERRCLNILADLWHDEDMRFAGVATTGSSEAILLAVLAARTRWRDNGHNIDGRMPNLVYSTACHPCWDKACRYFDVVPRKIPIRADPTGVGMLDVDAAVAACDADTIGVVATLGYPATGRYDPVAELCAALDRRAAQDGLDLSVHVDAASGGFVAPFQSDVAPWDFRLNRVASINASGHKYGMTNLGLGWVLWRDPALLPDSLCFEVNVLGGEPVKTFSLTFSRPAAPVINQYTTFLRLGRAGYRSLIDRCSEAAAMIATGLTDQGFRLWSTGSDLPVVSFELPDPDTRGWTLGHLSAKLRERGWQVPAYPLPADAENVMIARVVCRPGFSENLAGRLLENVAWAISSLDAHKAAHPPVTDTAFHLA
ncbi:glutamate decarboxylase [Actinocrispum wychmicini]|uniref:Glutamate decarboxylase n=1 Tax=Actinocrispum wychmicini TaxID=1213861 RepID=A0A4R2JDA5_9PSEU|nr:glutamate decarboxylase [Actinocrispum wychmicini]TCO56072.1 glutamate decarboxylase [Actinocrispum wychmicini]